MKYLFSLYSEYPKRACENLGVSDKSEEKDESNKNVTLKESDYPFDVKVDEEYMRKAKEKFKAFL